MLFIFSNFTNENKKYYSKVLIHLVIGLIFADTIWIIFITPNANYRKSINLKYLESLNSMHSFCFYLGIFEILVKVVILALAAYDYRNFFSSEVSFLFNFDYKINEIPNEEILSII